MDAGAFAEAVEDLDRQAAGVGVGLQHQRRDGADQHRLGDPAGAVTGDVAGDLAAAGGVADVDGVAQVEVLDDGGGVGGVGGPCRGPSDVWVERPWPRRSWATTR